MTDEDFTEAYTPYDYVRQALERFMGTLSGRKGHNLLRLKFLSIQWNAVSFQEILFSNSFQHPAPILQELSLRSLEGHNGDLFQPFPAHAPNLIRLNTNLSINTTHLLASDQLIELDLDVIEDNHHIILNHASSVERLSLHSEYYAKIIPYASFPRLVELDLRQCTTRQFQCSFHPFPNLKILRWLNDDVDTSIQEFNKLLLNAPQLKRLCLWPPKQYTASDANDFCDAVKGLPFLEKIWVLYKSKNASLGDFVDSITSRNSRIDVWTMQVTEDLRDGLWWNDEYRALV
jgi:hypothetical protein